MTLFDLLLRQRRFLYLFVAGLSTAGVWAAWRLPSAIYPELTFPRITIVAQGSTLGPRQVVFRITRPIEEAVSLVQGVTRVRSRSIRGASEISVTFSPRTDMTLALQQTQARVTQLRPQLPPDLDLEVERLTPSLFPILSYNLEGGDPATLYDLARYQIRPALARIPGVARVDIQGGDIHEVEVEADPGRLAALGMTYDELAQAIRQAITVAAVGRVARDYKQFLLLTEVEARTVDDVAQVIIRPGLRVRDVAKVTLGTQDRVRLIYGNGRPAALINVARQIGSNSVAIADSVAGAMATLQPTLPAGVRIRPVYDQASLVRESVRSVRDAMAIGALLVVVILFAFLRNATLTAISAASIPLTLAITVALMALIGQTFNLMSLGAMAIAIGLVIDDAVVVVENIARHLSLTEDRRQALRRAVQELVWPVTTSTITTVVVFLPLGLLQGVVGQFFATLSITLTAAMLVSLGLALTIIPLLGHELLARRPARPGAAPSRLISSLTGRYGRSLEVVLPRPRRVALVAAGFILLGIVATRFVDTGFLPEMDEGAFVLDYFTPGGTALTETDRELKIAEGILTGIPEIIGTSRRTGAELGLFATEQNRGDIVARLAPRSQRSRSVFEVMDQARQRIAEAVPRLHIEFIQILSDVINDLAGASKPVEIKLFGDRLEELEQYARRLAPQLDSVVGVVDLYNGVSEPNAEMLVSLNGEEAARLGLTTAQVGDQMAGGLLGVPAGQVLSEDRAIAVRVRAPDAIRFDAARLPSLPILGTLGGRPAPLGSLATLRETDSRAELLRENQRQMIAVTAQVEGASLGDVVHGVERVLAAMPPPHGVSVVLGGQAANQREAFQALFLVLLLAALSVVGVMVVQFESLTEPLVILLVAPVSFVGAIALLLVTGTALNVSSFMGLILLVGLIVKNGIILLDFAHRRMRLEGETLEAAIRMAAQTRLRPILMTTLCTLVGLLPLALGLGAGSELQRPLALTVIGGLAASTPITLYVVPTLVAAIRGREFRIRREAGIS
jgi:CzcA family heavy metal efflux pump